jgi:hypothetical protein
MDNDRITLYKYNECGYFTGEITETNFFGGIQAGWTTVAPPSIPEGMFAFFNNVSWELRDYEVIPPEPVVGPTVV